MRFRETRCDRLFAFDAVQQREYDGLGPDERRKHVESRRQRGGFSSDENQFFVVGLGRK